MGPTSTRPRGRTVRVVLISLAGVIVVLLFASQLLLPTLASRRLADNLERFGPRPDVKVSAFPALKLLTGQADRVTIHGTTARIAPGPLLDQFSDRGDADEVDLRVDALQVGLLDLTDVHVTKNGDDVTSAATVTLSDLQQSLRQLANLRVAADDTGEGILLEGEVRLFGRAIGGAARVRADEGKIVVGIEGLPLGTITVFDDDRLRVTDVDAREVPGGYRLSLTGVLTDAAG
ncbi:MAG: hypothetical protein JHC95_12935 [Solirubrobacteraceae bacterium]|nr:hypothetical protein [Solirubrobacteraceae bacterium]